MTKLIKYLKPHIPFIFLAIVVLFIQAFCDLSLPNIMAQLVNMILRNINEGHEGTGLTDSGVLALGLRMLAITLTGGSAAVGVSFLFNRIAAGVSRDLRFAVFKKVESFSSREFDDFSTASLITRCTNDVSNVQGVFSVGLRMIFYAPIMGFGGVFMAIRMASSMSWIIVVAVIVLMGMIGLIISIVMPKFKIIQDLFDRMNRLARETLGGLMVIRAFSAQEHDKERFERVNGELVKTNLFVNRIMNLQMPVSQLIMNISILIIIWNGAHRIAAFSMEVGDMMAFIQYTMQIIFAFQFLSMIFVMLPRASVSGERIAQVLEKDESIKDPANPLSFPIAPNAGSNAGAGSSLKQGLRVEFKNVSFRYEGAENLAISKINFTAEEGKTTAIIGATGSGKSTIASLILRFYDLTEGTILMDGVDIRQVSQNDLRSRIGYVPQKSILLSGSVSYNLRYGKINAPDEEIIEGAEIAQARDFIEGMSEGMESSISQGGANISGGQKQRLSIARALIREPELLIFDDSFSALDFATDSRLRAALAEKKKGITKIVIAQRVGTIMQAEKIIVLERGHIVGVGTHEELIDTCDEYREIAESQLEGAAS